MRKATIVAALLGLGLGCGGMGAEFTRSFNQEFVKSFVESCSQNVKREVCQCAADELVANKSPTELMQMMDNPQIHVQPLLEKCAQTVVP